MSNGPLEDNGIGGKCLLERRLVPRKEVSSNVNGEWDGGSASSGESFVQHVPKQIVPW
jgi:hypothetical protein